MVAARLPAAALAPSPLLVRVHPVPPRPWSRAARPTSSSAPLVHSLWPLQRRAARFRSIAAGKDDPAGGSADDATGAAAAAPLEQEQQQLQQEPQAEDSASIDSLAASPAAVQLEDGSSSSLQQQQPASSTAAAAVDDATVPTAPSAAPASALAALTALLRIGGDTLRLLLHLLVVEPLAWVLNRSGLLAIRAADLVATLEKANRVAPLEADRLAAALRVLNKHHPQATVEFVEKHCLLGGSSGIFVSAVAAGGGSSSGSSDASSSNRFAVNSAVVREYLSALVNTGRLAQFGDDPGATPAEGQSHRSLPQLLGELRAVAAGERLPEAPGATVARPLHVIVQPQERGGGVLSWLSGFFWSCISIFAIVYTMTTGAAVLRRLQGGSGAPTALPGGAAGVAVAGGAAASPGGGGMFGAAKEYSKEGMPEKSVKRFADVKGCDEAIHELQEIVEYLKRPEKFTRLGGKLPKGVLLTGPPGTGKTLLARAVAGEAGVPFFYKAGSEFDEMFVGVGSRRVRSLFAAAKKKAPCIVFIDEVDAVGGKRTNWESSGGSRKTLNQLLTEMDGFEENSGVVVMAATNLPEMLDTALTRPGRFDRQVAVPLPDVTGRQQILELYLAGKPLTPDVDADLLARRTPGFSGAELANLVNEGALLAARHGAEAVSAALLDEARDKILMGSPRILAQSEEARRLTAYHEGGHALVALHTPGAKPIHKATIMPRGHALGMVSQVPDRDEYSTTRQQMMAHIDVCMGGKAAEALIFGDDHVTSGATSDLRQATRMARHMVADCGMSDSIGPVAIGEEQSPSTRQAVDAEVARLLKGAYQRVVSLLRAREGELHALAQALLAQETLTQAEIRSLLENLAAAGGGSPGLAPIGTDGGVVKRPEPLGPMGEGAAEGAAQQPSPVAAAASMQMAGGPAVPAATKR